MAGALVCRRLDSSVLHKQAIGVCVSVRPGAFVLEFSGVASPVWLCMYFASVSEHVRTLTGQRLMFR